MRQAIHILRKDLRFVRVELGVVLALILLYVWASLNAGSNVWAEVLVDIGAAYLIARLIYAETLPGDRQFWLTRPYRRGSLFLAKLLGMVLLVNVPTFAARLYVLVRDGFALETVLPPLLWSQLLLLLGAMLPIAALAAVTRGMVPFTFAVLGIAAIALATSASVRPPIAIAARLSLGGTQWVWDSLVVLTLIAFAVPVLLLQYRDRKTWASRAVIAVVAVAGIALYLYLPWPTAAAIQLATSKQRFDPQAMQIALAPAARRFYNQGQLWRKGIQVDVPMRIEGIPADVELIPDAVSLSFHAADESVWSSGNYIYPAFGKERPGPGPATLNANVDVPVAFADKALRQKVRLTAELYLSFFGKPQTKTIPIQDGVDALDGLRCSVGPFRQFVCRAPFGWPNRLIYAEFPTGGRLPFTRFISYSPFPAGMLFDQVASRAVSVPSGDREVRIISNQPLGSFRRTFVVENFPIADYSNR